MQDRAAALDIAAIKMIHLAVVHQVIWPKRGAANNTQGVCHHAAKITTHMAWILLTWPCGQFHLGVEAFTRTDNSFRSFCPWARIALHVALVPSGPMVPSESIHGAVPYESSLAAEKGR